MQRSAALPSSWCSLSSGILISLRAAFTAWFAGREAPAFPCLPAEPVRLCLSNLMAAGRDIYKLLSTHMIYHANIL